MNYKKMLNYCIEKDTRVLDNKDGFIVFENGTKISINKFKKD